jgi:predicted NAD/FAD-binding protein
MKWIKLFESFNKNKHIAIIGGGVASLYCGYLIKKKLSRL